MTGALLGIDVGTSGVKGVAIDDDGAVLAVTEAGYPLATPRPGWSEQDPEDWWRATESVLAELGRSVGRPAAIGLSGQMHGLITLDDQGKTIRPAILWNDQRSADQCDQLESRIGFERLIQLTGNRAVAGFTAPKLLWLRANEPDAFARIARVALPKDYIRLRLCGEHLTDVSDASGTLLFDVAHRAWSEEMMDALELDPAWFPEAREGPSPGGETREGVPVAAGGGDQPAGAVGVGADRPGIASVVLGSSGVVFTALDSFSADREGRVHAFCHAVPGRWQAMGVMLSAAAALDWFQRVAAEMPYERLLAAAEQWSPGAEGLLFLPYLSGERTPHADPDARAAFIGLGQRHDAGALTRAVLEGVAFGLRDSLDLLRETGAEITRGRISGGGARSQLWRKIVASVLQLSLERASVDEGAAFGAALLAGVAVGLWRDVGEATGAAVRVRDVTDPVDEWVTPYAELRPRFRAAYPALRDA